MKVCQSFFFFFFLSSILLWQARDRTEYCLVLLVEFALAMAAALDSINRESFQNFKLRVGESEQGIL